MNYTPSISAFTITMREVRRAKKAREIAQVKAILTGIGNTIADMLHILFPVTVISLFAITSTIIIVAAQAAA